MIEREEERERKKERKKETSKFEYNSDNDLPNILWQGESINIISFWLRIKITLKWQKIKIFK